MSDNSAYAQLERQLDRVIGELSETKARLAGLERGLLEAVNTGAYSEARADDAGMLARRIRALLAPPSIVTLIERSSLGTPEAQALREQTPKHVVDAVLRRVDELEAGKGKP